MKIHKLTRKRAYHREGILDNSGNYLPELPRKIIRGIFAAKNYVAWKIDFSQ